MKVLYIAAVRCLHVDRNLGRGIRLWGDVFLTSDRSHVSTLITPQFVELAGKLEASSLLEKPSVVYQLAELDESIEPGPSAIAYLDRLIALTTLFLNCLWIVKDCSANLDVGFLEYPYRSPKTYVSSNTRANYWSNARGEIEDSSFTAEEIRQARDLFRVYRRDDDGVPQVDVNQLNDPAQTDRVARTLYFLQGARGEANLAGKVAQYVTCFESLLSTDSAELAHKLSERTAMYLGGTPAERLQTYRTIKSAYGVRSKVVHGDYVPAKALRDLARLSKETDTLLRGLLGKILKSIDDYNVFTGPANKLEEFMLRLVVGQNALGRS